MTLVYACYSFETVTQAFEICASLIRIRLVYAQKQAKSFTVWVKKLTSPMFLGNGTRNKRGCVFVCSLVREHISGTTRPIFTSGGVATRYIFPVL